MFIYLPLHIMPRFDGTGPAGQGSMTGRGMGPCAGQKASPRGRFGLGRGLGGGPGRGRGWLGCPWLRSLGSPATLEEEENALEAELEKVKKARKAEKK